jgi:predicted nucleotidyltransferase
MIKFKKLPENIFDLLPEAAFYLDRYPKVIFAYLFGGLSRGPVQPLSDIDIAIYLRKNVDVCESKLEILGKLMDILQTDEIDMVVLNIAELPLIINILKNKKVIVDKEPFSRHVFESLAMRKYFDFSIKETAILQRRYMHG